MVAENQLTHKRIRLRIPREFHQEPVISRLVSNYGLTVNITAAMLGSNGIGDGWFDLDLQGSSEQIESALIYINDLDLEIWHDINTGEL
ncbi:MULTISPECIES: NIL domain-containing protein [Nostocales]|uniref:ABC transporter n=3 Tax=Nostocales TaxID=1161 RepID=A0A0C1N230_9CYAN|nr:NIL domain-containing protein [Tolypothrix bouteillei]KAF3884021.1 ABC transporter [Tolypothrix bouteillei VB521301]